MATGTLVPLHGEVELNLAVPVTTGGASDRATGASGAAAAVTFSADPERGITLCQIHAGYDAAPQAGANLKVEDGSGATVWQVPITDALPHEFTFSPPRTGSKNTAMIVTLSAGGGSVGAYLNVNAIRVK